MKKLFLAAVSVCLLCAAAFAQDMPLDAETKADLSARAKILLKDVKKHQEKIQKIAIELPYQERLSLYNKEKKRDFGTCCNKCFFVSCWYSAEFRYRIFCSKRYSGRSNTFRNGTYRNRLCGWWMSFITYLKKTGRVCHTFTCSRRRYFARFMDIRHRPSYNLRFQIQQTS